jgi:hypothetical protein
MIQNGIFLLKFWVGFAILLYAIYKGIEEKGLIIIVGLILLIVYMFLWILLHNAGLDIFHIPLNQLN